MTGFENMFIGGCMSAIRTLSHIHKEWGGVRRDTLISAAVVDVMVAHLACKCHMYDYLMHTDDSSLEELIKVYDEITAMVSALRIYEDSVRHGAHREIPFLDSHDQPRTDYHWS